MNDARRKLIAQAIQQLQDALNNVEQTQGDEQDAYDNMPENMQSGEKGEVMSGAIDALDSAKGSIEEALDYLQVIE
jgi:hypothetical protein